MSYQGQLVQYPQIDGMRIMNPQVIGVPDFIVG